MKIYEVLIEYGSSMLDRPFSYFYDGNIEIKKYSRVIVSFNNRRVCGFVINILSYDQTKEEYTKNTGFEIKSILEVVDNEPILSEKMSELAQSVAKYYFCPLILVYFAMLPPSLKPSLSFKNKPSIAYDTYIIPQENVNYDNLTTRQAEILYQIISNKGVKKSEISPAILNKLIEKNKVSICHRERNRLQLEMVEKISDFALNEEQKDAYKKIVSTEKNIILLEGVTGSGKTEIYIQVAKKVIQDGKKVIMLVPEISLSYAMVKRFQTRFDKIAILHSELTPGQRYDEYRKIKDGEIDIVIGARSAIFAPIENLGLIIIDEEHSETYKQEDQAPYYHALEIAKMRQQKASDIKILLGSATPSLESKSRALKGIYEQVFLTKRVNDIPLPDVRIIDLLQRKNIDEKSTIISIPLREAIQKNLENKEQTILLINRRGYSPYISCRKCGYVFKCPECQVSLTYHKESDKLVCHHCGYEIDMVNNCPKCGSNRILKSGFGTEKIEREINFLFPEAKTLRLDLDIAKKRNMTQKVLKSFANKEADVLIGTQMISKGHDFDNVTLVGVVLADIGLAIPSFRASERTFNLITQAIGRAGRTKPGRAFVQTYQPQHFVIKNAAKQDYLKFYATEIYYRKLLQNPPYTYMTLLIVVGKKEDDVIDSIYEVEKYLKSKIKDEVIIIGPSDLFIKKFNDNFRRKLVIKYKNFEMVRELLIDLRLFFNKKRDLKLIIDVDPFEDY